MSDTRSMLDRRGLVVGLVAALTGAAAVAGFWIRQLSGPSRRDRERAEGRMLSFFPRPEVVRPLGAGYLAASPDESDRSRLVDLVLDDLGADGALGTQSEFRSRVTERIRADFAAGRTLRLEGWIVSRTEGRLAALVAAATASPSNPD